MKCLYIFIVYCLRATILPSDRTLTVSHTKMTTVTPSADWLVWSQGLTGWLLNVGCANIHVARVDLIWLEKSLETGCTGRRSDSIWGSCKLSISTVYGKLACAAFPNDLILKSCWQLTDESHYHFGAVVSRKRACGRRCGPTLDVSKHGPSGIQGSTIPWQCILCLGRLLLTRPSIALPTQSRARPRSRATYILHSLALIFVPLNKHTSRDICPGCQRESPPTQTG